MEIEIIEKKENPLLKRQELRVIIKSNSTPKKSEIRKVISSETGAEEGRIIVDKIETMFGTSECTAYIKIYSDEKVMKTIEPKHKLKEVEGDGEENSGEEMETVQSE